MFIKCFINQKQCKLEIRLCKRKNGEMLIIPTLPAATRKESKPKDVKCNWLCSTFSGKRSPPFTF